MDAYKIQEYIKRRPDFVAGACNVDLERCADIVKSLNDLTKEPVDKLVDKWGGLYEVIDCDCPRPEKPKELSRMGIDFIEARKNK